MSQESPTGSYVHGYASATDTMSVRTVENFATFMTSFLVPGMSVLDAGCGPGTISTGIAALVGPGSLIGFDIEQSQVDLAVQRASEKALDNTVFEVADVTALRFEDDSFDFIFSCAVLEHVPDVQKGVNELIRTLKPGGILALKGGTPSRVVPFPSDGPMSELFEVYLPVWEGLGGHPEFGVEQIDLLRTAGFEILSVTGSFENRTGTMFNFPERIRSDNFVRMAEELGLSTKARLDSLAARLEKWRAVPGTGILVPWIEVVARKPH